jgi:hypothetical protein
MIEVIYTAKEIFVLGYVAGIVTLPICLLIWAIVHGITSKTGKQPPRG